MRFASVIDYPNWLRKCLLLTGVIHDIAIISAGLFALTGSDTPLTLSHALDHLTIAWGLLLIIGGLGSFIGSIARQVRLETAGCVTTAAAKMVWVVAALQQPGTGLPGTEILALILVAGAAGTMWRFCGLWVGYYLRVRG